MKTQSLVKFNICGKIMWVMKYLYAYVFIALNALSEIISGPSHTADGTMNMVGALRRAMATCGYSDLKEFQRCEVVVTPN